MKPWRGINPFRGALIKLRGTSFEAFSDNDNNRKARLNERRSASSRAFVAPVVPYQY